MKTANGTLVAVLSAALLVASSGCSVLAMSDTTTRHPYPPDCTSSRVAPGVDTYSALSSVAAIALLSGSDGASDGEGGGIRGAIVAAAAVEAIAFGASAAYGFNKAAACRKENERWTADFENHLVMVPPGLAPVRQVPTMR